MRKLLFFVFFLLTSICGFSQQDSLLAGFLRYPTIPPFTLLKIDSTNLTREDLTKNKKLLIMYFSPECDHCLHQTDSMLANLNKFKDVEILMATYQPLEELKDFNRKYGMNNYANIKMGRDTKYFFAPFYKMHNLPFLVLYDKKGKLLTTFEGTTPIEKLVTAFK